MSNEYLPLAKHLKGEGLQEGTVLEAYGVPPVQYEWTGKTVRLIIKGTGATSEVDWNPFNDKWRIVSTPPKKITFEASVWPPRDGSSEYVYLPRDSGFSVGDTVIVTVEEIENE